ncbi:hypothetical protein [Paenibacillus cucumis (ex Kampfer et al. 2016)]|uniref:Transposase n=1 Tax=Paenibacillus cucumis (ex Kampfer et al. 2016) TaxID=1776858 RepID=A0ABS7KM56_9BACL|nr:hypothetical protein [Paenibacillus cucumis (ex Kampfer et al. 2016)]MBY0205253.1 hypothetical protein [Paenibacillus cucumis (ex Kampfer et al. 2016)]
MREVRSRSVADSASKPSKSRRKPLPYVPEAKIQQDYTDSQKRFSETFNQMRERLLELGEMQQK